MYAIKHIDHSANPHDRSHCLFIPTVLFSECVVMYTFLYLLLKFLRKNHVLINPDDGSSKDIKISRSNVLRRDEKIEGTFSLYIRKFWMDRMHADKIPGTNILLYIHIWSSPCISIRKNNFRVIFITKVQTVGKNRLFKTNIQRNEIARPQSQFLHSCFCERLIYAHDQSAYSAAGK